MPTGLPPLTFLQERMTPTSRFTRQNRSCGLSCKKGSPPLWKGGASPQLSPQLLFRAGLTRRVRCVRAKRRYLISTMGTVQKCRLSTLDDILRNSYKNKPGRTVPLGDNVGDCAGRVPRSHCPLGRVECHKHGNTSFGAKRNPNPALPGMTVT